MVLSGDIGYGKSLWLHKVCKELLENSTEKIGKEYYFPIYIDLATIDNIENLLVDKYLKEKNNIIDQYLNGKGFEDLHIEKLKSGYKILVLIENYDNIRVWQGHSSNKHLGPYLGNPYED